MIPPAAVRRSDLRAVRCGVERNSRIRAALCTLYRVLWNCQDYSYFSTALQIHSTRSTKDRIVAVGTTRLLQTKIQILCIVCGETSCGACASRNTGSLVCAALSGRSLVNTANRTTVYELAPLSILRSHRLLAKSDFTGITTLPVALVNVGSLHPHLNQFAGVHYCSVVCSDFKKKSAAACRGCPSAPRPPRRLPKIDAAGPPGDR